MLEFHHFFESIMHLLYFQIWKLIHQYIFSLFFHVNLLFPQYIIVLHWNESDTVLFHFYFIFNFNFDKHKIHFRIIKLHIVHFFQFQIIDYMIMKDSELLEKPISLWNDLILIEIKNTQQEKIFLIKEIGKLLYRYGLCWCFCSTTLSLLCHIAV